MGALVLGYNRSVIGISLEDMNEVRRKIGAAQRKVNDEKNKLSSAIRRLQVDNSSRRIRMSSNELSIHLRKAAQIENKLNKMATDIDYTVRRFREVDKKCASRIKSVGLNYRKSAGLLTKSESLFQAGKSFLTGDFGSLINQGKEAFGKIKGDVVNWYHKNEAIINNIATIALEGLAAIGTVAAIAAGALTGVGLVIAVAGLIYGASNMIDSGVKLYNYTTTGEEKGFNFIQEGMKAALGNDLGNKVFEVSNIALAIANVAQLGAGAYRLLKEKEVLTGIYDIAKNAKTYGKAFTEALTDLSKGSVVLGMNGGGKQLENIIEASKRAKGVLDAEKEAATAIRTGENIVDDIARSGVEEVSKGNTEVSKVDEIITDGSHLENGKLKPNVTYKTGEHDYIYRTNEDGFITNAHTDDLQFKTHTGRLDHDPNTLDKEVGDHAGHLFGDRFGGSPELDNLVSQARKVNLSEFKIIENQWAKAVGSGQKVTVDISINYATGSGRPISFDVAYTIDGVPFFQTIGQ